jgi:hypothetical protein
MSNVSPVQWLMQKRADLELRLRAELCAALEQFCNDTGLHESRIKITLGTDGNFGPYVDVELKI